MTEPEVPRRPRRGSARPSRSGCRSSPCSPSLVIVSIVGLAVYGVVPATDASIKDTDDLPVAFTQALTFFQDLVFVFAAWIGVKLALGSVTAADLGLRRVRRIWPAVGWATVALVAFYLVAYAADRDLREAGRSDAGDRHQGRGRARDPDRLGPARSACSPRSSRSCSSAASCSPSSRAGWASRGRRLLDGVVFGIGHAGGAEPSSWSHSARSGSRCASSIGAHSPSFRVWLSTP